MLMKNQIVSFFLVNTSLQSIFIYPTQKFRIIWENYGGNESSMQKKNYI